MNTRTHTHLTNEIFCGWTQENENKG